MFRGRDAYQSPKMVAFLNVTLGHKVILSAKIVKQDVLRFVHAVGKIQRHLVSSCEELAVEMKFEAKFGGDV